MSVNQPVPEQEEELGWEAWISKEFVHCRGLQKQYSLMEEARRIRNAPRVIKAKELPWQGGPQHWNKYLMCPAYDMMQSIESHIEDMAPGARSQNHGHMNEAIFYILEGSGYEIHDGKRYDWKAGDCVIVHNACVHQHFNASDSERVKAIVIKTKPLYILMNLLFQQDVEKIPKEPTPGWEHYHPDLPLE